MTDDIDVAGRTQVGDRVAWSGTATEPVDLLARLARQLGDVAADCSVLHNISVTCAQLSGELRPCLNFPGQPCAYAGMTPVEIVGWLQKATCVDLAQMGVTPARSAAKS